jgi:TonB family protein
MLNSMPLRCLLFSSNEEMVQPIWQVLTDLGIEGEYCKSGVDAVEKVTTQPFQIVITDWEDQPEAAFLLKTARDLKAAQRPLTLAIVSDDARLPEALQAGANSVLVKPIRPEQVRDTMSTACELLRAKFQPGAPQAAAPVASGASGTAALAAAAAAGAGSAPASVTQSPEKTFRAGEFLQSPGSKPGGQFDTECEVQKSLDQAAGTEVDALTELEPTASAVDEGATEPAEREEPLTGWVALQARLTKSKAAPKLPVEEAPAKTELLSYGETPSSAVPAAELPEEVRQDSGKKEAQPQAESEPEAALFAYMSREPKEISEPAEKQRPKFGKILLGGMLAACVVLVAVPQTRQRLPIFYQRTVRAGRNWLNPPPAAVPQTVAQHDSFGQEGDEYKLPTPGNIPDATTDASQIRVLPVVDPTAKPEKGSEANGGQAPATAGDGNATDQNPTSQNQTTQNQTNQNQAGQGQSVPAQTGENQVKDSAAANGGDVTGNTAGTSAAPIPSVAQVQPITPMVQAAAPALRPVTSTVQSSAPQAISPGSSAGIPSSLKSQIASSTPETSGAMPAEAAMSSIEPVKLPEAAVRELLDQPVDPEYPEAAKAGGQRGSVVLQVFIGRDGAVQDAKFLQGSLVFARAAIDAVKQWHFKPYSMNGRAVSVQSVITLNFKPPA